MSNFTTSKGFKRFIAKELDPRYVAGAIEWLERLATRYALLIVSPRNRSQAPSPSCPWGYPQERRAPIPSLP